MDMPKWERKVHEAQHTLEWRKIADIHWESRSRGVVGSPTCQTTIGGKNDQVRSSLKIVVIKNVCRAEAIGYNHWPSKSDNLSWIPRTMKKVVCVPHIWDLELPVRWEALSGEIPRSFASQLAWSMLLVKTREKRPKLCSDLYTHLLLHTWMHTLKKIQISST